MGSFINRGNVSFATYKGYRILVDKSMLLSFTNQFLGDASRFMCVTRPRRFGKTMTANMVAAYYDQSCDSRELFSDLDISGDPSFEEHLNKYFVIKIDVSSFAGKCPDRTDITGCLKRSLLEDLFKAFPSILSRESSVADAILAVFEATGRRFVFVIDEWDAIFREYPDEERQQEEYLVFLKTLFKDIDASQTIALCYMTGILPVKKYNTDSSLNNFKEFTMLNPRSLAPFVGFLEPEVKELCSRHDMDFLEMKRWYDGYSFSGVHSVYSPFSVVNAITDRKYESYWTKSSSYERAERYINENFAGLKEDVIKMLAGERCKVITDDFAQDFGALKKKSQVLTLLIHFGYLAYDEDNREAYIPNMEVADRLSQSVVDSNWDFYSDAINKSEELLHATWNGEEDRVAEAVESFHEKNSSIWSYNKENDLALVLLMAYYAARKDYEVKREMQAGKGFADLVFVPKRNTGVIPMILELKWNQSVDSALEQIKRREYPNVFADCKEVLICGINYDTASKKHTCKIEKISR